MHGTESLPRVLADLPLSRAIEHQLADRVQLLPWHELTPEIEAIYTYGHPIVDDALLTKLPRVRVISNFGVGIDHIDLAAARVRGIPVGNTPGVLDGATADLGFSLMLAAGRRIVEGDRYARGPAFLHYDPSFMLGQEIYGRVLGIVGMGRIGEQVARRARGFDMGVLYHNRRPNPNAAALGAAYVSLEELLASADFVIITLPLTRETAGLIGRPQLAMMKPTACLINIARGAIVDIDALTEALCERRIFAAALDVTDPEPLPRQHPLLNLDNIIITPHLGSATEQTRQQMAKMSVDNLFAGLTGAALPNPVPLSS